LHVVVPVFNEAQNLERLFAGLRAVSCEAAEFEVAVILVDDGSADETPALARALGEELDLTVLTHGTNRGPGHAFGTAFAHLASRIGPVDYVLTMEGDNTSRTELIGDMLRRADEGHDAVLASPYMYGGGILHTRASRVMLSHIANTFVKEFLGVHGLLTVSSFFRLYRGTSLLRLQETYGERIVQRDGFESMIEVVMKMMYLQMSLSELPMVLDTTRRAGRSKMNTRRTILGYFSLFGHKREWKQRAGSRSAVCEAHACTSARRE
jgi:glycosyltransferase involved in cell wall biosynthesis